MEFSNFKHLVQEYETCIKCGACLAVCPTYEAEAIESYGPRGRVQLAGQLILDKLNVTPGFTDKMTSCIDCKACVTACPRGVELDTLFYAAKEKVAFFKGMGFLNRWIATGVRWGWPLFPVLKALDFFRRMFYEHISATSLLGKALPFIRNGKKRNLPEIASVPFYKQFQEMDRLFGRKRRVAFFPGCVINFSDTEIGKATVEVLRHYGIEVVLPPAQLCCGIPLISMGEREEAKRLALRNIEMLERLNVEAIITSCASCAYTFKKEYPKLLAEGAEENKQASLLATWFRKVARFLSSGSNLIDLLASGSAAKAAFEFQAKVRDIHEYLEKAVNYTQGLGEINQTITFHDPCHLKRGLGISESPRKILQAIPGVKFKEMTDADRCCGFGGIFSLKHYDLSMKVANEKVHSIHESRADRVATGCPGCSLHIGDALSQAGKRIEVKHTVQILAESIQNKLEGQALAAQKF